MLPEFFEQNRIEGLLGVRAIVHFAGRFFSPVYGHCEWTRGVQQASCAIGCHTVPGDRHQGCGFHAHWNAADTQRFVEQIFGTADCLVLIECFGRVSMHEKGLRAERARIVAVLDWDPARAFYIQCPPAGRQKISVPFAAARYFGVPMLDEQMANAAIDAQRYRCEVFA